MRSRLLLGAGAVFALLVVPVAMAASGDSGDPQATASASVKKKVKRLKGQVKTLSQRLAALEREPGPQGPAGPQGPPGATNGPAGGDLTGDYPDPQIAPGAVGPAEIALNGVRSSEVLDDSLSFFDLAPDSVGSSEIAVGSVGTSELNSSSVRASEVGDGIVERESAVVTIAGGTEGNGDANVDRATASCLAGEELVGASANWTNNINPVGGDQTPGDEELYTMEVDASTTAETASAIGANDTDNDHDFRAVAYCLVS